MKKISPSKSFSFGISRAAYQKVYDKQSPSPDPAIPGPGTYPVRAYLGREGRKSSLKARFKNLSMMRERHDRRFPGRKGTQSWPLRLQRGASH